MKAWNEMDEQEQHQCRTYTECTISAKKEYYKILTKQKLKLELELGVCKDTYITELYKDIKQLKNEKAKDSDTRYYGFFTFNFDSSFWKDKLDFENLFIFMNKLTKKNWMSVYSYCIEQRGETLEEMGKGLHVHLLFERNGKRPSECERECYNTFNKYTGHKLKDFVKYSCKYVPYDWGKDKLDYMSGLKWDEAKAEKAEMDKVMRKQYNLKTIYTN